MGEDGTLFATAAPDLPWMAKSCRPNLAAALVAAVHITRGCSVMRPVEAP